MSNIKNFRYDWIWDKMQGSNFLNAHWQPMKVHEVISVFSSAKPKYNPQGLVWKKRIKKNHDNGSNIYHFSKDEKREMYCSSYTNYPQSIIKFKKPLSNGHPTQKPENLLQYLIKTYTDAGDVVLDNTMGSGSTCVACIQTGRKYIGFEMENKYFEIAKNRISIAEESGMQICLEDEHIKMDIDHDDALIDTQTNIFNDWRLP